MVGRNKSEVQEQTHVIKSARRDGGYGRKIGNRFQVGIPDLLLVVPGHVPGVWEMKDLGEVRAGFKRKVDTTTKQDIELEGFLKACGGHRACGMLITYKMAGLRSLAMLPLNVGRFEHSVGYPTVVREKAGYYNLPKLFYEGGVATWRNP